VTEDEWLSCADSHAMLDYLAERFPKGKRPSLPERSRAFRLFNVACCYRVWPWLQRPESRRAVVVAERYADGLATDAEREEAFHAALRLPGGMEPLGAAWEGRAARRMPGWRSRRPGPRLSPPAARAWMTGTTSGAPRE